MASYTIQDLKDNLDYINETKKQIKQAIIDKGQAVEDSDTFRSYVDKIKAIEARSRHFRRYCTSYRYSVS